MEHRAMVSAATGLSGGPSGVVRPLSASSRPVGAVAWRSRRWRWVAGCVTAVGCVWVASGWISSGQTDVDEPVAAVQRTDLLVEVQARGELESAQSIDVQCEVEATQIKIMRLVPEGARVQRGDAVVELDTRDLIAARLQKEKDLKLVEQEVAAARRQVETQSSVNQAMLRQKERALDRARMEREKYLDPRGEYHVEYSSLSRDISETRTNLSQARDKLQQYRKSEKKGFLSREAVRSRELEVDRWERQLESQEARLYLLERFTFPHRKTELETAVEDAQRELLETDKNCELTQSAAETHLHMKEELVRMAESDLARLDRQIELCTVRAPQDGIVVYAKDPYGDLSNQIKEGANVRTYQKLFSLPNLDQLQVRVKIHESRAKRVWPGQAVQVRLGGASHQVLQGTVIKKDVFPDSNSLAGMSGVKEYTTIVRIDSRSEGHALDLGMTAEVSILVARVTDSLVVPLPAVTERNGEHFCYVVRPDRSLERRPVQIGESNETHVAILDGLSDGASVSLEARRRLAMDLKRHEAGSDGGAGLAGGELLLGDSGMPEAELPALPGLESGALQFESSGE